MPGWSSPPAGVPNCRFPAGVATFARTSIVAFTATAAAPNVPSAVAVEKLEFSSLPGPVTLDEMLNV